MTLGHLLETTLQDLRYALRGFRRNLGFTLTAILAVAIGIGATTAVFSVVDRLLFRSLPYPQDAELVSLGMIAPIESIEFVLGPDYLEWRNERTAFQGMSAYGGTSDCDLSEQPPLRLSCVHVESTFLPLFGIQPVVGRNFTRDEDRPLAPKVALLSYGLWQQRFGGDPSVAGRTISLDGQPTQIVGVLPRDFEMPTLSPADVVMPYALDEARQVRPQTGAVMRVFGRLKPGLTPAQGLAALQPYFERSLKFVPPRFVKEVGLRVRSLRDRQTQDARLASLVLLGAVGAVLLIACANVANLLLARSAARRRELAVRAALGAGRARLIRQTLAESLLLALMGGVAGCALGGALLRLFVAIAPQGIPRLGQATLDLRVLLFTLGVSLISGTLFGLAPALENPHAESLAGGRTLGSHRHFFRQLLMAGQIAISVVLLAGAGLLLHSLWNLLRVPLGLEASGVLYADVTLSVQGYRDSARQMAFFDDLESRLRRVPGVSAVALADTLPPSGPMHARPYSTIEVQGRPRPEEGTLGMVGWRMVTPEYFSALGVPILRGRGFEDSDRTSSENAMILSESLARRLFPGEDPLGKRINLDPPWFTVVGIARDVHNNGLTKQADPEYYVVRKRAVDDPVWRGTTPRRAAMLVRCALNCTAVGSWIRSEIAQMDATLPVQILPMAQRVDRLAERPRFNAVLLGLFAAMGVLLAAIGLYGVVSFLVTQRTQEIGVRMALGATPARILGLVLGHTARWTASGAALGLAGTLVASRLIGNLLFGVSARDPLALGSAVILLLCAALLAAWLPSRRASLVDPMAALRQE